MKVLEVQVGRRLVGVVRKGVGYVSRSTNTRLGQLGQRAVHYDGTLEAQPTDIPVYCTSRVIYDCMSGAWVVDTPERVLVGWFDPDKKEFRQLKGAPVQISVQRPVVEPKPGWEPVHVGDRLVMEVG